MKASFSLLILLLWFSLNLSAKYTIDRLEPPFWWTDMKNTSLQLLVYGKDISDLNPHFDYPGVSLNEVIRVNNPNYLFINLNISKNAIPGSFAIDFKDGKGIGVSYTYVLYERDKGSAERQGFNTSDAMYLITPDRFANGNLDNDNIDGYAEQANRDDIDGRHGGDLAGIMKNLGYIAEMGFTAIWLNPVLENNMPRTSYHGYATTDFYKVDPRYGSNEDFVKLTLAAKKMGIKMIMDMIMNHCGSEHWWMKDMPSGDWINYGGEYVNTNHRRTTVQDPYVAPSERELFHDGWFVSAMPDMNQNNPLMAKYLIQNSIWWIEYAHLQGIRHDTHSYPDKDFMSAWSCAIMEEYPNFNIVGEEWSPNPALVAYWQKGKENPDGYTSCMPCMMDFPSQMNLTPGLTEPEEWNQGFIKMYEGLANDFQYADPYNLVIFPDNHDMSRIYTQLNEDFDLFQMAITYILTMRGIPQLYYGTEILMSNPKSDAHGEIRSDFPGGWDGDETNAFEDRGLNKQQLKAKNYTRAVLNWRKNKECLHKGKLTHYNPLKGVYVYFRYTNDEMVMVILNKNETEVKLKMERFSEIAGSFKTATDLFTDRVYFLKDLTVPARSPLILELR